MLVSSIARFNALKNAVQTQTQATINSFHGVQNNNKQQSFNPFSLDNLKSAINKLNILA